MLNFLFVVPRFAGPGNYYVFPVGLAYVVAYMKHKGFNVSCLNLCHREAPVEQVLSECIKDRQIDVLCTGAMSFYWDAVNEVVQAAKRIKPDIVTVVGGAIITAHPELTLRNMPIDFGIIGEGEETMADLAEALCNKRNVHEVRGLVYSDANHNRITTEARGPILDLDSLPFPDYEGLEFGQWLSIRWVTQPAIGGVCFDVQEEQRLCEIVTSRSCPFRCTFCYHPLGNRYRQRSLDNVFKEIDYLTKEYGITILNLLDELFSLDAERIYEFADRIKKYPVRWMAQWRVTDVDEQMLKTLKNAGLFMLGFGVESLSDKILQSMKKRITKAQIERAFALSLSVGVHAAGNIILGDPQETEETMDESIGWWLEHPEYDIYLGCLLAVPDAPVYQYAMANNLIKDEVEFIRSKYPVINLTKVREDKFWRIKRRLDYWTLTEKHLLSGAVLSSEPESELYEGKRVYHFQVKCPLCHHTSEYRYFPYSAKPFSVILCKHCYKRLKVKTKHAFPKDYHAIRGFLFHYAFIVYLLHLKKYRFFHNAAKGVQGLLLKWKIGLPGYGGWLSQGNKS